MDRADEITSANRNRINIIKEIFGKGGGISSYSSTALSLCSLIERLELSAEDIRGQSYKQFMLVNYDSRVVVTSKLLIFTTLDS